MTGLLGRYPASRDASGTAWQPESTPHEGVHLSRAGWMVMTHGYVLGVYDRQGGQRGGEKGFSESMLMATARRPLGGGSLGLRAMLSLEPAMGNSGYPLLLQTGETADGRAELVDRQHPHDLFMELAGVFSRPVGEDGSVFAYFGLPGEPALGPPAFMHRSSGVDDPEAPLGHHWLDSTHITYGVATVGWVWRDWKLEGSAFRGREPDQHRWDLEAPDFDSYSGRVSFNPSRDWALQASYGALKGPEQLEPEVDVGRLTASASLNWRVGGAWAQTTFAWGQNRSEPGPALDALLLETAVRLAGGHTVFGRAERVEKDELLDASDPRAGTVFAVGKLSLGYAFDFARWRRVSWGLGAVGSLHLLPAALEEAYGGTPGSVMIFARAKLF